jgi:hypothetical protein
MPARDSNASFLFLVVLITGVALAALGDRRSSTSQDLSGNSSNSSLYETSESWRTSVRIYAAAR